MLKIIFILVVVIALGSVVERFFDLVLFVVITSVLVYLIKTVVKDGRRCVHTERETTPEKNLKSNDVKKELSEQELERFMQECNARLAHEDEMKKYM